MCVEFSGSSLNKKYDSQADFFAPGLPVSVQHFFEKRAFFERCGSEEVGQGQKVTNQLEDN